MTKNIWVVISVSCTDCNSISVATFDHSPTKDEILLVDKECGGMYCIRNYSIKTTVNDNPVSIDTDEEAI